MRRRRPRARVCWVPAVRSGDTGLARRLDPDVVELIVDADRRRRVLRRPGAGEWAILTVERPR